MSNRTLTALYDTRVGADAAKARLATIGVTSVEVHDEGTSATLGEDGHAQGGFMAKIRNLFGEHEDAHGYAEGLRRGHLLLTAQVDDARTDQAIEVLEGSGAVDFDDKQSQWSGAGGSAAAEAREATHSDGDKIDIAEERLLVGKREVDRGGVRVRSYIVTTPVSERVTLRDEQVDVELRPVNRELAATEDAFRERTIEMTETGEEAVVEKQAYVTEQLVVSKTVSQRTEEINDTLRRTEVEVERLDEKDSLHKRL